MHAQNLHDAENELHCSVCTEMFVKAVTLSCSHTFCKYCIVQWQKNEGSCPICRSKITMQLPTVVVDNYIEKILEGASEEVKQHRRELLAEREAALASPSPSTASTISTSSPNRRRSAQESDEFVSSEDNNSDREDDTDDMDEGDDTDDSGSDWEEEYYIHN